MKAVIDVTKLRRRYKFSLFCAGLMVGLPVGFFAAFGVLFLLLSGAI